MTTAAEVLRNNGIKNGDALVIAATRVGIPLYIAAAFAQKESNGKNIYGHDKNGVFSLPGTQEMQVTQTNYQEFYQKVVVEKRTSNGVGPMQITWSGYFPIAKAQGFRLWIPLDNFVFGLRIIRDYLNKDYSEASLSRAGQRYNSGSPTGAPVYGNELVSYAREWKKRLSVVTPPKPPVTTVILKRGSKGAAVKALQTGLNRVFPRYSDLTIDGDFGAKTEAVVKEFQKRSGLKVDGIVGTATRTRLAGHGIKF